MNELFLQAATLTGNNAAAAGGIIGMLIALGIVILLVVLVLIVAVYIYSSLAYVAIARKAKYASPNLAWIPVVGPAIVTNRISGMAWWPILLIIGAFIPYVGFAFSIAFAVFSIIWLWKTMEVIGRPGWWAILIGIIPVVNLIMLGIAAWGKN